MENFDKSNRPSLCNTIKNRVTSWQKVWQNFLPKIIPHHLYYLLRFDSYAVLPSRQIRILASGLAWRYLANARN